MKEFAFTIKDQPIALSARNYGPGCLIPGESTTCISDVVYSYGPNAFFNSTGPEWATGAAAEKRLYGTGTRSRIPYSESWGSEFEENEYFYFRECVCMAFRATLTSMKNNSVNYPILCYVSGGIYSGEERGSVTNRELRRETRGIIEEINKELGEPFNNIFLCG